MNSSRQHYLAGFLAGTGQSGAVPVPVAAAVPEAAPAPHGLSWEEQTKRELLPYDAFPRLAACARADEPPSEEDRFRFEWFGLFYQGPEKDAFIARVRLPGGRLREFQCFELARIVQELAGGWIELNVQGGLDVPGVPVRAGVELLRRLEGIGLSTRGTGGDCVRAVRGGEREDVPMVWELEHALLHGHEFGNLPGPCEVAFRAAGEGPADDDAPERIVFHAGPPVAVGPGRPDPWPPVPEPNPPTWRVSVPGVGDLGVAVAAARTVPVCLALLRVWSRQADRESRAVAALANFCREVGSAGLREAAEEELGQRLTDSPLPDTAVEPPGKPPDSSEVPGGRLLSGQMEALARAAAQHGVAGFRVVRGKYLLAAPGDSEMNTAAFEADLRRILSAGAGV